MKLSRTKGSWWEILAIALPLNAAITTIDAAEPERPEVVSNLVLWDTLSPLGDKLKPDERSTWKLVPNDLLLLEKNPPKASSDPGYYGRDYSFAGDAVVETPTLTAVFRSAKGCVALYAKEEPSRKEQGSDTVGPFQDRIVELSPLVAPERSGAIEQIELLRNVDDKVVLKVSFSAPGSPRMTSLFSFDRTSIVEVKPVENMNRVRLSSSISYGVVPSFIGDDLIFGGLESYGTNVLAIPSENMFLGLLAGESTELLLTWPKAKQRLSLRLAEPGGETRISAIDFDHGGQPFYLAALSAPGIWHKETLTPDYLEKEVRIQWKRPFPAKWKTQLTEEDAKTTFAFRPARGEIWRGVAGSYVYPVWFTNEDAFYYLGKKVVPKGESVIYCLEGRDTPAGILTPADILEQTLGRPAAEPILDLAGRKLRTHHRRGGTGVRRACTCGCTEAIQAVFEAGDEVNQKDYIQGALDDMIYFIHCHVERINEYRGFADDLLKTIHEKAQASADLKPFLDNLEEIAQQIPQQCEVQKENMKTFEYADELSKKTMALTAQKDPTNLKAYLDLLKAWREMGGAQDSVLAKCHIVARNLSQAAGYGCAAQPAAVSLAEEIRARCRQVLRNPDGYEVWADY